MRDLIGRTLGHYRIVDKIGSGGMGEVYRANDERLDRDVAIKVLPEEVASDKDRVRRFGREARAVAALSHPNILEIFDFDTEDNVTYSVTELLEGETLREHLAKERGPLPWRRVQEIGAAVASGLGAAHGKGVVHRDIKPSNIFVCTDGRVKILDFGLAATHGVVDSEAETGSLEAALTREGKVLGTVGYMSPEQVRGEPADHRTDIFSLGCVLYEMLSGKRAFKRDTTAEIMTAILREEPPSLTETGVQLPPAVSKAVEHCLEKNQDRRYQSATDLAFELESILSEREGVTEAAPSQAPTHRSLYLAPVLVAAVLFVATTAVIWFLRSGVVDEPEDTALPRIVVLPFENLGSPDDEYFADGITEEITSRLAAVSGLQVISRTSAMYYKYIEKTLSQIGEELKVEYALEGTVRWDRSGEGHGRVRITPQLVRVADDSHLWSDRYDRALDNIFEVQSDIAEQVIHKLQVTLLEPEQRILETRPTDNMEAYQAYLVGLQRFWVSAQEEDMRLAADMFERAVQLDPGFAVGHAALSEAYSALYHLRYDFTRECLDRAREAAKRAMALQPGLPEAHRALGYYYYWGHRDYERALDEFATAAERVPNDEEVLGGIFAVLRRQGRWSEIPEALDRWLSVAPGDYSAACEASMTFTWLGEYARAEEEARRAIAIAPDLPDAYRDGAWNYVHWDGTTVRARRVLESAPSLDSPDIEALAIFLDLYDREPHAALERLKSASIETFDFEGWFQTRGALECFCLSEMGEEYRARAACVSAVESLEREIDTRPHDFRVHMALGRTLALLGRHEEAMDSGEHAVELVPISKDALIGASLPIELAQIYSRVGETEKALDLIEELLSIPSNLSMGLLRLDPGWDPLREHPRFQALLEKYDTN